VFSSPESDSIEIAFTTYTVCPLRFWQLFLLADWNSKRKGVPVT